MLVALKSLWFAGWCWELAGLEADNWYLLVLSAKPRMDGGCPWLRKTQHASPAPKAQVGVGNEPCNELRVQPRQSVGGSVGAYSGQLV